jgi:class 3 adenylate cyclase
MESHSLPNRIQVSAATHRHLQRDFLLEPHGSIDVKGRGLMETYFLLGRTDTLTK